MKKRVYIIGAGPGDAALLTAKAAGLLAECGEVFAARRLAELMAPLRPDIRVSTVSAMPEEIEASAAGRVAALVSGDAGFYSIASSLAQKLAGSAEVEIVSGISSMQYLCAKLGVGYEGVEVMSLHGRQGDLPGRVAYNRLVFALTGGSRKANDLCRELHERGSKDLTVTAGENLSMPGERIVTGKALELSKLSFGDLTVLLIENPGWADHNVPLTDGDFIRGKTPMTKEEVRWIAASKLAVRPGDTVYDIGAGTGSVAVELARKAYRGTVYAVEREEDAARLTEKNREKLGAWNIVVQRGEAPDALGPLPAPDRAFIGGSGGALRKTVEALLAKNPRVRLAVTAVSLETLAETLAVFSDHALDADAVCVNAARAKRAGGYRMMTANNPVYIISGEKR